ncbi:FTR1 family protein [Tumebacillus sp. ITR2]|uniref:FTR1 family protein n=1 Tax=Tumebacillus amylolyticus TaxID=2801339 RepID=A0ABS1J668_9BACL|nr:FTR1 family protein [Tumebacillus amylolyticus]MBL0385670.1 FTR1 family protein [Tumebacillus amylolyticus]
MARRFSSLLLILLLFVTLLAPTAAHATDKAVADLKQAEQLVEQALNQANQGQLPEADQTYQQFRKLWLQIETGIKTDSSQAYKDIESNMGQVDYALMQKKQDAVVQALNGLKTANEKFISGGYGAGESFKQQDITLPDFIGLLQQTKQQAEKHDIAAAQASIAQVRESWLSVEGVVVAQSAGLYNDSERDMVTVDAMLHAQPADEQGAATLLQNMINYLTPLADKSGYTMWDAAFIPIREGLEALLVVAALLAFVNKSKQKRGRTWVWAGVGAGLLFSIILAVVVKVVFSAAAFGSNNSLIAGWTGVIAAVMLLYMSYWLHSQSKVKDWNLYIKEKSEAALNTGKLVSFGVLSFLAIFREGTETVLFLIGMVNQISMQNLILGLVIGMVVLVVIAVLMLFIGVKLPMRPFFMVSSFIVFYLCLKFTGMGIHSLQLAGTLPSTTSAQLPSADFIALYPSWVSTVPQLLLVVIALGAILIKKKPQPTGGILK